MYSNNGSSYRPGGDLYRPGRHNQRQGNYKNEDYAGRGNERAQNYPDRSSNRSDYRSNRNTYKPNGLYNGYGQSDQRNLNSQYGGNSYGAGRDYGHQNSNSYQQPRQRFQGQGNYTRGQKSPGDGYHLVYSQIQSENQLWMGDLDPRWSENDILDIWTELGERPTNVKIMRDKTGRSQYCFVTFSNPTAANTAVQRHRTPVPGSSRIFKLNKASGGGSLGASTGMGADQSRQNAPGGGHSMGQRSTVDYSLFVGDLAQDITEQMLYGKFNQKYPGVVKQVKIMTDMNTGMSKGFGFVRFHKPEAQQAALKEMNGVILGDRPIRVGLANGSSQEPAPGLKKAASTLSPSLKLPQQQPSLTPSSDPNNCVLDILGINYSITRDDLVAHYGSFGTLVYCKIDYKAQAAQVKYLLRGSAEKAFLFTDGFVMNGCNLGLRWGSEERPLASAKVDKSVKYSAAEKPPTIYGEVPDAVVLEDLSEEQLGDLKLTEPSELIGVSDFDQLNEDRIARREAYLALAY
ncbi:hypothetical protein PUMCH_005118 [Australozyma saopauloensis]|uniref:RRM domain-containing protein n=1 Tax=Australozyma saopauloensis TaxID=291208 RepID=A0AAX4HH18_9ASCO|nr:hypothetical protein PUMCH_005118 [[Candida] saopauloensis]